MNNIYIDNASTSFPKAPNVAKAMYDYMSNSISNINRSTYKRSNYVEDIVYDLRCNLDKFFNGYGEQYVVFTKNITESLNVVLKGFLKSGDHVLISSMEHNALVRPLIKLSKNNITFDRIPCDAITGDICLDKIESMIKNNTKAIVCAYANNVCGTVYPIDKIGAICKKHNIKFILDSAQGAGILPIDMKSQNIDVMCFTGHKSLLGPQGIGGFLMTEDMAKKIDTFIEGGTGSISDKEDMPSFLPDKFEAGTMNIPGMIGLNVSLKFIMDTGIDNIRKKEFDLTKLFLDGLKELVDKNLIRILGHNDMNNRVSVVSITTDKMDLATIASVLDEKYNISVRVGLQCAPSTHKALGSFPMGSIRFSIGYFNKEEEILYAVKALKEILA